MNSNSALTTPRNARQVEGVRLVYYASHPDSKFWDKHWQEWLKPEDYTWAEQGRLPEIETAVMRYLPLQGKVIEAGCGPGWYVLSLCRRGYDAEGVEYAQETVRRVLELYPNLPVRVGDVTRLDVPDGYYAAFISLGVVEHRQEGPEPFLKEAYRVLQPGGKMLISVPCFHVLRRIKAYLGLYRFDRDRQEFYQYAFKPKEFVEILTRHGFEILEIFGYDATKGLKDEIPPLRWLLKRGQIGRRVAWLIERVPLLQRQFGHMLLVAARKV